MSAKEARFNDDARQRVLRGVNVLANAVKAALGPRGRNAVLEKTYVAPTITKDGVAVAKEIELPDRPEATEPRALMKLLDSAMDAFLARFGNAAGLLAEQLAAQGVNVWVSSGCLAEFAEIARVAAGHSRQVDESYGACLRREMETLTRFILEWTDSDRQFEPSQYAELVAIAHRYALPRRWRLTEPHASVRGDTIVAQLPRQPPIRIVR